MDHQLSDFDITDAVFSSTKFLNGTRRFSSIESEEETISLDVKGISESTESFTSDGRSGEFTETWSGYLYVPETGHYSLMADVDGGVRLTIDDNIVIDKMFSSKATWSTAALQLEKGDFISE